MNEHDNPDLGRRRALALIGGGTVALTSLGLGGCGGDEPAPKPELVPPEPDAEPTPPIAEPEGSSSEADPAGDASAANSDDGGEVATGDMPRLDESSAQAQQLAYVHDASTLEATSQPRYEAGQQCANCALYQGGDSAWGGCPLFQGRLVKATGWCNGYAPAG